MHLVEYCDTCDLWAPCCQCASTERVLAELEQDMYICNACFSIGDQDLIWPCNGAEENHRKVTKGFPRETGTFHQKCMEPARHHRGCEYSDDPLFLCRKCVDSGSPAKCPGCKQAEEPWQRARTRRGKQGSKHRKDQAIT